MLARRVITGSLRSRRTRAALVGSIRTFRPNPPRVITGSLRSRRTDGVLV